MHNTTLRDANTNGLYALPPSSSRIAQLESGVSQAEQFRDQQVEQEYSDQLGVYVREKAEQIDRLQSTPPAVKISQVATTFAQMTERGVLRKAVTPFRSTSS